MIENSGVNVPERAKQVVLGTSNVESNSQANGLYQVVVNPLSV
jgi:hypothetical protein